MKKKVFELLICTFLFLVFAIPTVSLAKESAGTLPGDFFYFLDRFSEKISLAITKNSARKAEKALKYAEERFEELQIVARTEDTDADKIEQALDEYKKGLELASNISLTIEVKEQKKDVLVRISDSIASSKKVLEGQPTTTPASGEEITKKILATIKEEREIVETNLKSVSEEDERSEELIKEYYEKRTELEKIRLGIGTSSEQNSKKQDDIFKQKTDYLKIAVPVEKDKEKLEIKKEKITKTPPPTVIPATIVPKTAEKAKEKITPVPPPLPFKEEFVLIPVNWNSSKSDFNTLAEAAIKEFKKEYIEVYKKVFPLLDSDEGYSQFEFIKLSNCIDICRFNDVPNLPDLEQTCINRCQEKKTSNDPIPTRVALTNDDKYFRGSYQEYTNIIADLRIPEQVSTVTHEIAHLFWLLCDEYKYSVWQWQDEDNRINYGVKGCPNPYPLTCSDHPQWNGKKENYRAYIKNLGLSWNGYVNTDDETAEFCLGAVCTPSPGYNACRSIMGPAIHPDDVQYFFGGKLERKIPIEALLPN